jgi:hypothetical protein
MHTDEGVQVVQSTMQAEDDAIMPARVAAKEIAFGSVSAILLLLQKLFHFSSACWDGVRDTGIPL